MMRAFFLKLAGLGRSGSAADPEPSDEDGSDEPHQGQESRVAYRLAYEAALEWTAGSYATLEAFRNRAAGFLAAAVIAVAAGIGVSGIPHPEATRGCLTWIGLLVAAQGFAASFVGAVALMRPLKGPFVLKPKTLAEGYGDEPKTFPTDDATYRTLAMWGQTECSNLADAVQRRCRWLYVSMAGLPVTVVGVVLVWIDATQG